MAYPLVAAALALTAAGTGMQVAAANQSRSAMNDARNAEMARQKKYQGEANAAFEKSLQKSGRNTADAEMAAGEARRQDAYSRLNAQPVAQPVSAVAGGQGGPTGTNGAAARTKANTTATANAWTKLVGNAQARLGGADDWQLQQGLKDAETNRRLAITSSNARGSANLLPLEMEQASHAGDGLAGWGQLVSALGSVTALGAATAPSAATTANSMGVQSAWSVNAPQLQASLPNMDKLGMWGSIPVR